MYIMNMMRKIIYKQIPIYKNMASDKNNNILIGKG